jgi:hypothetical protein
MNPQFRSGAERAMRMIVGNAPIIAGTVGGALVGDMLSPRDEPGKYRFHGAVIGLGAGLAKLRSWKTNLPPRWQVST